MLRLKREFQVQDITENEDGTYDIAFSSESPVEREILNNNGMPITVNEILVHEGPQNADLTRINNGAALLFNHNFDSHLGIVVPESVRIDPDRIGRAKVKFSKVGQLATEIKAKVDEGTISKISFGYDLNEYHIEGNDLLVTLWSPYEISFVTVPADDKVGLGRIINTFDNATDVVNPNKINKGTSRMKRELTVEDIVEMPIEELVEMTIDQIEGLDDEARAKREEMISEDEQARAKREEENKDPVVDPELTDEEREEEIAEIEEIAERYHVSRGEVRKAIAKNMTARQFKRSIKPNTIKAPAVVRKMTKDTKDNLESKFEFGEALRSVMKDKPLTGAAAEYTQEMTRKRINAGRSTNGRMYLPVSALARGQRAINSVPTVSPIQQEVVDYGSFVELLLKPTVLGELGVNMQTGLTQPYTQPKWTSSSVDAFGFVAENGESPEGESAFTNIQFMPHTFTGGNPLTRQALETTPNLEAYISDHIVKHSRAKIQALMFGSATDAGGNAPASIVSQLVAKQLGMTYKEFVVAAAEAEGNGVEMARFKYLIASALGGDLRSTLRDQAVAGYVIDDSGKLGGYDVVTSGLLKPGTVIGGDFSAITVAEWDGLALDLDDTTYRNRGAIVPRVWCDIDWKVTADDRLFMYQKAAASTSSK